MHALIGRTHSTFALAEYRGTADAILISHFALQLEKALVTYTLLNK